MEDDVGISEMRRVEQYYLYSDRTSVDAIEVFSGLV